MKEIKCPHCEGTHVHSRGSKNNKRQFHCQECSKYFSIGEDIEEFDVKVSSGKNWSQKDVYVITSCYSNTETNETFFKSLRTYCKFRDAQLYIIPIKYNSTEEESVWDDQLKLHFLEDNIEVHHKLKILGKLKVTPSATNPLSGLDAICKGSSIIIGHPQLQLKTLPVAQEDFPVILTTTGTVSEKNYTESKSGYKAEFNHSLSATVVEIDRVNDLFHIRQIEFDGKGFFDLEYYFDSTYYNRVVSSAEALITGDEHVLFNDPEVKEATYNSFDSIRYKFNPAYIVRHDILDCYSISHHHNNDTFVKYAKYQSGTNSIEDELNKTVEFLNETGKYNKNVIISSNHTDHLTKWLNEADPKDEPWNAMVYHKLMYLMLSYTKMTPNGVSYPNPFELYYKLNNKNENMIFVERNKSFKILGIECAFHGDKGSNGVRGSRAQYAKLPYKTVIGHSHSPGIEKGCYQVGTSSYLQLEYNLGPSSWMNSHCIIYKNSKRTLINIIKGKWRLDK